MTTKTEATGKDSNIAHSYLGWSTEEQNYSDSERRQFVRSKQICASMGWTLVERTIIDRAMSSFRVDVKVSHVLISSANRSSAIGDVIDFFAVKCKSNEILVWCD
jgi:hypothetical protein